ncbi:Hypothetical_protein [Hexamita inflata]|uniref:Hypothetical_protein n=1 Tax=Hexamita inflata TaxID=28002 RepID=A0ABP1HR25_9EUKA
MSQVPLIDLLQGFILRDSVEVILKFNLYNDLFVLQCRSGSSIYDSMYIVQKLKDLNNLLGLKYRLISINERGSIYNHGMDHTVWCYYYYQYNVFYQRFYIISRFLSRQLVQLFDVPLGYVFYQLY